MKTPFQRGLRIMTVKDIQAILKAAVLNADEELLQNEVHTACGSDMMSDVLAFVKDQSVLLTGLVNPQVVRTAEMMDMVCIVFVRGKRPDPSIVELARERGIAVLSTPYRMFTACGLLYENGLKGGCTI
jgi:predicted transcriptional regulator